MTKFKDQFCGTLTDAELNRVLRSKPDGSTHYPSWLLKVADAWLRIKDPNATDPTAEEGDAAGLIRHTLELLRESDSDVYYYLTEDNKFSATQLYKSYFDAEMDGAENGYKPVFSAVWGLFIDGVKKALNRSKLGDKLKKKSKRNASHSDSSSESSSDSDRESKSKRYRKGSTGPGAEAKGQPDPASFPFPLFEVTPELRASQDQLRAEMDSTSEEMKEISSTLSKLTECIAKKAAAKRASSVAGFSF